jgi:hypothetical protein
MRSMLRAGTARAACLRPRSRHWHSDTAHTCHAQGWHHEWLSQRWRLALLVLQSATLCLRCADTTSRRLCLPTCSQYQRRYAILDGREADLDAGLPVSLVPVISKVSCWEELCKASLSVRAGR